MRSLQQRGVSPIDLPKLAGFSEGQKNENPNLLWTYDSVFWWEKGIQFSTGKQIYLPAQILFWNYLLDRESREPLLRESNTNGCAGMFTKEEAILAGLYELIQRDAFLIHWLNSRAPLRIDPATVPDDAFRQIHAAHERYGYKTYCFNITLDLDVPSFAVMLIDPSGKGPYLGIGAASSPSPIRALRKAIEEAHSVVYWARTIPSFNLPKGYLPFYDESVRQRNRVGLWGNSYMAKQIDFFLKGEVGEFSDYQFNYPEQFASPRVELDSLINRIEKMGNGYEVYVFTPSQSLLSRLGYMISRVVVPQFVPLYLNEVNAPLGAPRLSEVPRKLGWKNCVLNTIPHPFS